MISILIPVKNGGEDFARCLDAIATQRIDEEFEVVVVDSGSVDGTPDLARERGARVTEIPAAEFHHGGTRNLAAGMARGERLVFTTHDAYPDSDEWLARLVRHLDDPEVAGAYGRQVAHHHARPPERFFLDFVYGAEPRVQSASSPAELSMETTMFSNVNSAVRKEVLQRFPFSEEIIMSEDQDFSRRALLAGMRIVYDPEAVVRHSHDYTIATAFRHFFDLGVSGDETWLAAERPSRKVLRRNALRYGVEELRWMAHTRNARWIPYVCVYEFAKWLGLTVGTHHRMLSPRVKRRISLVPFYWDQREARERELGQAVR